MTTPAVPLFRPLKAQWIVLATICVLLFQAFTGGPVLPRGIGLADDALILCTDAGFVQADDDGRSPARHDCGVFCQTLCHAAPLLLRGVVLVPLPGIPALRLSWDHGVSTPALSGPVRHPTARGPPRLS